MREEYKINQKQHESCRFCRRFERKGKGGTVGRKFQALETVREERAERFKGAKSF